MENIKESLLLAMLENQCKIMAKLKNIEKRFDAEAILRTPQNQINLLLDQFEMNDKNEMKDFEEYRKQTYDRAEKINKKLENPDYIQDI